MGSVHKNYSIPFKHLGVSISLLVGVMFIPIYTDLNILKFISYGIASLVFTIYSIRSIFTLLYTFTKPYQFLAYVFTIAYGLIITSFCLMITVGNVMFGYDDFGSLYIRKGHPNITIVSRYWNEGAFGGGTQPSDFQDVVSVSILPHFKLQLPIDIKTIDKDKWAKSKDH